MTAPPEDPSGNSPAPSPAAEREGARPGPGWKERVHDGCVIFGALLAVFGAGAVCQQLARTWLAGHSAPQSFEAMVWLGGLAAAAGRLPCNLVGGYLLGRHLRFVQPRLAMFGFIAYHLLVAVFLISESCIWPDIDRAMLRELTGGTLAYTAYVAAAATANLLGIFAGMAVGSARKRRVAADESPRAAMTDRSEP